MKKIIVTYLILPIVSLLIFSLVLTRFDSPSNDFLKGIELKEKIAEKAIGPKIILAGGSNLAFGIKSSIIKETTNKEVVNLGIMAGLGVSFMSNQFMEYVSPGDLVVFVPEYTLYFAPKIEGLNPVILSAVYSYPPSARHVDDLNFIKHEHFKFQSRFQRLIQSFSTVPSSKIYRYESFDENGEVKINHKSKVSLEDFKNYNFPIDSNKINNENFEDFINYMKKVKSRVENKGASLVLSYPPGKKDFNFQKSVLLLKEVLNNNGFEYLGKPSEFAFGHDMFFDDIPHLTQKGAELRTIKLANILKKYFNGKVD